MSKKPDDYTKEEHEKYKKVMDSIPYDKRGNEEYEFIQDVGLGIVDLLINIYDDPIEYTEERILGIYNRIHDEKMRRVRIIAESILVGKKKRRKNN